MENIAICTQEGGKEKGYLRGPWEKPHEYQLPKKPKHRMLAS